MLQYLISPAWCRKRLVKYNNTKTLKRHTLSMLAQATTASKVNNGFECVSCTTYLCLKLIGAACLELHRPQTESRHFRLLTYSTSVCHVESHGYNHNEITG